MLLPFLNLCRGFMLIIWSKIPCFPSYGLVSNLFVSTVSHYCFIIYSSCTCLATCLFTSLHVKLLESTNNVLLIFFLYPVSTFISAKVQEAKWITRFHQLSHHLKGHLCLFQDPSHNNKYNSKIYFTIGQNYHHMMEINTLNSTKNLY